MKKIIIFILIVSVIACAAAYKFRGRIFKSVLSARLSNLAGARVEMDAFYLNLAQEKMDIRGFSLYNPEGFAQRKLIFVPRISADFDLGGLLRKELHLRSLEIDLDHIVITKDRSGKLNIDSLKFAGGQEKKDKKLLSTRIDLLSLSIGNVISEDYDDQGKLRARSIAVNIQNRHYKNITGLEQLLVLIFSESLRHTAFKGAAVYGAASLAGVAVLPVGAAVILSGKDSSFCKVSATVEKAYEASLEVLNRMGKIKSVDRTAGLIKARVRGAGTVLKIKALPGGMVKIVVSSRKLVFPAPDIAGGIIYEISENIK